MTAWTKEFDADAITGQRFATILPSETIEGDFCVPNPDARGERLLIALRAQRFGGLYHLTPRKADKYRLLFEHGFDARGGLYWRARCKPMPLHDAMNCIAAYQPLSAAAVDLAK